MKPTLSRTVREKLEEIAARFEQIEARLADPATLADPARYRQAIAEHGRWAVLVGPYRAYRETLARIHEAETIEADPEEDAELRTLAHEELQSQRTREKELARELESRLVADDADADRSVVVEIRAGTGGEEAALFAADLYRMYLRFAETRSLRIEVIEARETDLGGYKEIVFAVQGRGAHRAFRYECGVHRVQRVPQTEASGRIHTSAVTVAVLPEPEEVEVEIREEDLRVETFAASGPGGQHVNKTSSAVRISHIPTGIVATCQDEKSQHMNRARAMRVLRSRVYDLLRRERDERRASARRSMIGTGDRSERIRTYNFPQNRVTDHRIGFSHYDLEGVLLGRLDPILDRLQEHERRQRLREL